MLIDRIPWAVLPFIIAQYHFGRLPDIDKRPVSNEVLNTRNEWLPADISLDRHEFRSCVERFQAAKAHLKPE